jgi:GAF domain-containing protein
MKSTGAFIKTETQRYTMAGILFGSLFPVIATIIKIRVSNLGINFSSILAVQTSEPLLWIIDTAPLFLGIFAFFAGKWHDNLQILNTELRQREGELLHDRTNLEQRVDERTASLLKKTDQLRAASFIARQTAEVQDLETLLKIAVKLITDQFGFYHTGIFLINETGNEAVLQAASSEGGRQMIENGHALSVGTQGIVGYVAAQKKSRIALDVGMDAVFFNNPDLPMTRSEVAIPLMIRDKVLGILDIQSDKPQAFNLEDIDVLETLADQVAVAIENARLLDESQAALMQLEALTTVRTRETWGQKLQEQELVYTYTPLGLRAEKTSHTDENAAVAPVNLRGQKIGAISMSRKGNAKWGKVEEDLIAEVAAQVGLAIDNIRLLEEAKQRARQEQTVGELVSRFSQSLDVDSLLQTAARELGQLPEVSEVSVFISQVEEKESQARSPRLKRRTG